MPAIQVRDVPDHIYRQLAERAASEHRSLAQQAIAVLARGLEVEIDAKARRRGVLERIESGAAAGTVALSDPADLLREDRRR
jgi:hypothetical protein